MQRLHLTQAHGCQTRLTIVNLPALPFEITSIRPSSVRRFNLLRDKKRCSMGTYESRAQQRDVNM
jgi:hypothetical protein